MILLLLILLLLLAHVKIAILQRNVNILIDGLRPVDGLRPNNTISPEPYQLQTYKKELNPQVLHAFHCLSGEQRKAFFLKAQSTGHISAIFELFWSACHEINDMIAAKHFQDSLLLLDAESMKAITEALNDFVQKKKSEKPKVQKAKIEVPAQSLEKLVPELPEIQMSAAETLEAAEAAEKTFTEAPLDSTEEHLNAKTEAKEAAPEVLLVTVKTKKKSKKVNA